MHGPVFLVKVHGLEHELRGFLFVVQLVDNGEFVSIYIPPLMVDWSVPLTVFMSVVSLIKNALHF